MAETGPTLVWKPNKGPQTVFLACPAYEALYGGAAGGGKSDALLLGALRFVAHPSYRALLLRRTFPELERSLIARARVWYEAIGAKSGEGGKVWRFPSGAEIEFGHVEREDDVRKYLSAEYQYIGFDELTTFTEYQYTYLLSRLRSSAGIPVRVRSGTNPGGEGHAWVMRRWAPWLDRREDYGGRTAVSGETLYYKNTNESGEVWCDRGHPDALARVFVQAFVQDNPHLMDNDPAYVKRLAGLGPVERAQLLGGRWDVQDAPGALWRREWITRASEPARLFRCAVGVDPSGSAHERSDACGIVAAATGFCGCKGVGHERDIHAFVLADKTGVMTPKEWGEEAAGTYNRLRADLVVGERNFGGDMVAYVINTVDSSVAYRDVVASRGKQLRAEPVSALYQQGRVHHVGTFTDLENELCSWDPVRSKKSPNRLDALVHVLTELMLESAAEVEPRSNVVPTSREMMAVRRGVV